MAIALRLIKGKPVNKPNTAKLKKLIEDIMDGYGLKSPAVKNNLLDAIEKMFNKNHIEQLFNGFKVTWLE
ncbi:hypothetical protein [Chitinophaga sp.]|uniref:hypothetical protein n=1 Tax=Chitinophaga sp. TaxID=1869181 RepID=UPI0031DBDFA5